MACSTARAAPGGSRPAKTSTAPSATKVHPQISEDGPSKRIRNGVGVDRDGKAHFVIAASPVSFGQFARYFRDVAKTPNALYLDGTVSSLWDPARGRMDTRADLGPLVVVETKE